MSDLPPPPPDLDPSSQAHHGPAVETPSRSRKRSKRKSPIADEIAVVGFWCTVGCPVVFLLAISTAEEFLLVVSGVILLIGLGLSIAGVAKRGTSPTPRGLAVAGVVIAIFMILVSPFVLFWAIWVFTCC